jgi:hypothetical protein
MIVASHYRAQASFEEGELHVDVMRFFAIIAVCLFAVLSAVGGQSNDALTETAKTPGTYEMPTPAVGSVGNVDEEVEELSAPSTSQGIRFKDNVAFQQAVINGAVTLWKFNDQHQYQYEVEAGELLPSVMPDELFFSLDKDDAIKFLERENARRGFNAIDGDWYITLPKGTLSQLGKELRKVKGWVILDESASIAKPAELRLN